MTAPLHLVRLALDPARLFDFEQRLHLPRGAAADLGYLVHCQLGTLFGEDAPAPFALEDVKPGAAAQHIGVLGYSARDGAALRAHAQTFADPRAFEACDWATFASKPLPETFERGMRLGFATRVSPFVRTRTPGEGAPQLDKDGKPKAREVDAFLAACWQATAAAAGGARPPVDREQVYRDWLARELGREGASTLESARLVAFQRAPLTRRTQGAERRSHRLERPDARIEGTLTVTDPLAFRALLARGVGRHRAFGFGMLLLRPAR
jgi:CRISPR system Cascade subunit CasE